MSSTISSSSSFSCPKVLSTELVLAVLLSKDCLLEDVEVEFEAAEGVEEEQEDIGVFSCLICCVSGFMSFPKIF